MKKKKKKKIRSNLLPAIRRAKFDRLDIYEVSETELELLERGSPESLFLNFAIFLLSTAVVLLIALFSTTIESARVFEVFVICTVCSVVVGIILLVLWVRAHQSITTTIRKIKRRMIPEVGRRIN